MRVYLGQFVWGTNWRAHPMDEADTKGDNFLFSLRHAVVLACINVLADFLWIRAYTAAPQLARRTETHLTTGDMA